RDQGTDRTHEGTVLIQRIRLITAILFGIAALTVAGLVISALSVVGTDEITETPSFEVEDGTYAVVLDEAIVPYSGSSVTVSAKNSKGTELFIGTANGVDADSYLDGVAQEQISDVTFPKETAHRFLPGQSKPEAAIGDRDWWISRDTGKSVSKTFALDVILAGCSVCCVMRWGGSRIRPPKKDVDPRPDDGSDGGSQSRNRSTPAESAGRPTRADDQSGPETQPISTVQPGEAPPRRRDLRRRRSLRAVTAASLGTGLRLTGCASMPIAKPSTPDITPYERIALRPGEAGEFMTDYTESLDKTLGDDGDGLDKIQAAPLIDRTRAQIQI